MTLESKIEAILFWKGEPVALKDLAKFLEIDQSEVETSLTKLAEGLENRGLRLVRNGPEVMLYTAAGASELIKKLSKDELSREVSKAAVEVLSLVVYRGPISKREIDFIRGVNSSYIVRNLLIRGLVERVDKDGRSFTYLPTMELLALLGVSRREDLPDFAQVEQDIAKFMSSVSAEDSTSSADSAE